MNFRKHQNFLAFLYFGVGYFTSFCCMFTGEEVYVKSFGVLLSIYYTYMISEQFIDE